MVGWRAQEQAGVFEAFGVPREQAMKIAGLGHWWMLQDPAQGAAMLEMFWASLDS